MASNPTEIAMEHRKNTDIEGEPLLSATRRLQQVRDSLQVNVMSEFRDINGLEKGDKVVVEAYTNKYVIRPVGDE